MSAVVKEIILHPEYNYTSNLNDVAILKLKTKLNFTDTIKNACLPGENFVPQENQAAVVSGWGDMIYTSPLGKFSFFLLKNV